MCVYIHMCIYRAVKSREGQAGPVPLPPFSAFWPLIIFIVNDSKKELEKCYVLKTEIHYHWRKKSLNKASNKSHNCNKFSLFSPQQTTQRLCFSIGIMGKNII